MNAFQVPVPDRPPVKEGKYPGDQKDWNFIFDQERGYADQQSDKNMDKFTQVDPFPLKPFIDQFDRD